ncbi:hypothetical protein RSAG8_09273, partial [Rhizoctonia solani AG-8 WAC10335]
MQNPTQFKIPTWFLNRQKDIVDGKNSQILSNAIDSKMRDDLERLKKIRAHRGLRHYWGLRVRGQHTKTTGRRGKTVGVSKKRGSTFFAVICGFALLLSLVVSSTMLMPCHTIICDVRCLSVSVNDDPINDAQIGKGGRRWAICITSGPECFVWLCMHRSA